MEDATGISVGDALGLMKNSDGDIWGGGGMLSILLLFVLMTMFGGFGGGRGPAGQPVTEAGLCNAMNFNGLQNDVGRLSNQEDLHMMQLSQGLSSVGYENLRNFADTQSAIKDGDYALSRQLADCCCTTQRAIDATNAHTTEQTQKVLDALAQNKADALQAQVNELKMQQLLCGVPRVSPYGYSMTPTFPVQPSGCGFNSWVA